MNAAYTQYSLLESYLVQFNKALNQYYRTLSTTHSPEEMATVVRQQQKKQVLKMVIWHLRFILMDQYPMSESQMITRTIQRMRNVVTAFPAAQQQKMAGDVDALLELLEHQNCHLLSVVWPLDIAQWQE